MQSMPNCGEKVRKELEKTEEEEMSEILTVNLRLAELETGFFSSRKVFSEGYIDELAESIEREGQLKPIIVRPHPRSRTFALAQLRFMLGMLPEEIRCNCTL